MFPGLSTRISNDLKKMVLDKILKGKKDQLDAYKINVEDPPNRRYLVYLGATVLANLSKDKPNSWAWKKEYREAGADAIIRKWQSVSGG
jgi:actin-related protein 2